MNSLDTFFDTSRCAAQQREQRQIIKEWARDLLALASDTAIMVTENECLDPRCPGIETIIALLEYRRAQRMKISKPMIDVTKADIIEAIRAGKVLVKNYPVISSP